MMQAAVFNNDAQGVSPALRTKSAMTDINLDRKMMSIRLKEDRTNLNTPPDELGRFRAQQNWALQERNPPETPSNYHQGSMPGVQTPSRKQQQKTRAHIRRVGKASSAANGTLQMASAVPMDGDPNGMNQITQMNQITPNHQVAITQRQRARLNNMIAEQTRAAQQTRAEFTRTSIGNFRPKNEGLLIVRDDISSPLLRGASSTTHRDLRDHTLSDPAKSLFVHATISTDCTGNGDVMAKMKLCALSARNSLSDSSRSSIIVAMDHNAFMMNGGGMQTQQRPQPQNDQTDQDLLAKIVQELRKNTIQTGWQSAFDPAHRAHMVISLVKALRMLNISNDLMSAVQVAMRFEGQILASSPSEEQWMAGIKQKLQEISNAAHHAKMKAQQQ